MYYDILSAQELVHDEPAPKYLGRVYLHGRH